MVDPAATCVTPAPALSTAATAGLDPLATLVGPDSVILARNDHIDDAAKVLGFSITGAADALACFAALDRLPRFGSHALGRGNHAGRNDPDKMYLCNTHAISRSIGLILDPDPRRRDCYLVLQLYPHDLVLHGDRLLYCTSAHLRFVTLPADCEMRKDLFQIHSAHVAQRRRVASDDASDDGHICYALHDLHDITVAASDRCSTNCLGANIGFLALMHAAEAVPTSSPTSRTALRKVYFNTAGIPGYYLASAQLFEDCSLSISTVVLLLSTRVQQTHHIDSELLGCERSAHIPFYMVYASPVSCVSCIDSGGAKRRVGAANAFFDRMCERDDGTWSAINKAYEQNDFLMEAVSIFREMLHIGISPNCPSVISILTVCAAQAVLDYAGKVRGAVLKCSLDMDTFSISASQCTPLAFDKLSTRYTIIVFLPLSNGVALFGPVYDDQEVPVVFGKSAKHIILEGIQSYLSFSTCFHSDASPHRQPWPTPVQFEQIDGVQFSLTGVLQILLYIFELPCSHHEEAGSLCGMLITAAVQVPTCVVLTEMQFGSLNATVRLLVEYKLVKTRISRGGFLRFSVIAQSETHDLSEQVIIQFLWDPGGWQFLLSASMAGCALIQKQVQRNCGGLICSQSWLPPAQDQFVQIKSHNDVSVVVLTLRLHQHSVLQQLDNCTINHQHVHLSSNNGKLLVGRVDGRIDAHYIICFSADAMAVGDISSDKLLKHPWPPPGLVHLTHAGVDLWVFQWLLQLQFYHLLVEDP